METIHELLISGLSGPLALTCLRPALALGQIRVSGCRGGGVRMWGWKGCAGVEEEHYGLGPHRVSHSVPIAVP